MEVNVYAAIDTSGSMAGQKCAEICHHLKKLIEECPGHVKFHISLFSTVARKVAHGLKSEINTQQLIEDIEKSCARKGMTALYDAWGDILTSIPPEVSGPLQIFVLTDGEDNASKRYNFDSITKLTDDVTGGSDDVQFNFIQVGKDKNVSLMGILSTMSLKLSGPSAATSNLKNIKSLVVDDSANGIRMAMTSLHSSILNSSKGKTTSITSSDTNADQPVVKDVDTTSGNNALYPSFSGLLNSPRNADDISGQGFIKHSLLSSSIGGAEGDTPRNMATLLNNLNTISEGNTKHFYEKNLFSSSNNNAN